MISILSNNIKDERREIKTKIRVGLACGRDDKIRNSFQITLSVNFNGLQCSNFQNIN